MGSRLRGNDEVLVTYDSSGNAEFSVDDLYFTIVQKLVESASLCFRLVLILGERSYSSINAQQNLEGYKWVLGQRGQKSYVSSGCPPQ